MRRSLIILSLLLACLYSAKAVVVTDYDPSLLSSTLFSDITRDRKGYLWVGTEYGLNKFDGVEFTAYYGDYGRAGDLHTSRIVHLYADTCVDAPTLWVLFYGALQYYDDKADRFEYVDLTLVPSPALVSIRRIAGELLLESKGSGYWRIGSKDGRMSALALSDYSEPCSSHYSTPSQWSDESQHSVCFRDADGTVWRGTRRKTLSRLSPYGQGATYIPLHPSWSNGEAIYSCLVAPSGRFYVGQIGNGLRCIDKDGQQIGTTKLPGLTASCTLQLRDSSTIIGTTTQGMFLFAPDGNDYRQTGHVLLSSNKVKSIVESEQDGIVYVGCMEGGVFVLNTQTQEVRTLEGYYPTNIYVNKLMLDESGILWIGHYSGIDRYDTRTHQMVKGVCADTESQSVSESLLTSAVYDLLRYEDKTYCASNKGLFVSERQKNGAERWSRYTMEEGLPSNVVCRLLYDGEGHIWMSTFHGIAMFSPSEMPSFINYYRGSGMQALHYIRGAGELLSTGEMFFPDDEGVTVIDPKHLAGRPFTRPIVLSNLYMSGTRVNALTRSGNKLVCRGAIDEVHEFRFSYLDNVITMQFSPLDMRDNKNLCYQYRLVDDDYRGWRSTLPGESSITFSHLGYGRHVLLVRAQDGTAYSETSKWIIRIIPPLYLRWWAILLYIFSAIGIVLYGLYARYRAQERQLLREQLQFYINRPREEQEHPVVLTVKLKGNDQILMEKMMDYIAAHLDDSELSVDTIADAVGASRAQLQRKVKDVTGTSVGSFVREVRLKQAAKMLLRGDTNIAQVGYAVGFTAPNIFSTAFKKYYGVSPKEYVTNNTQQEIE